MRPLLAISLCLASPSLDAREPGGPDPDLLRFVNGDALHGSFAGLKDDTIVHWTGSTIAKPMEIQATNLRRIAFNGGRARKSLANPSYILLPNGDRIPGSIRRVDQEEVTIETAVAGPISVRREHVMAVVPNPHGGTLQYMGPFSPDGWKIVDRKRKEEDPKDLKLGNPSEAARDDRADREDTGEDPWVFGGGAWYSNGQLPIAIDAGIPDKTRIAFTLGWRSRLSAIISFHSTLEVPEPREPEEDADGDEDAAKPRQRVVVRGSSSSSYPYTYGQSYVLTIYSSYAMLYRCDFNEDGQPVMNRLSSSSANVRLDDSGEAEFELRCDRENNSIALFVNGHFVSQWEDAEGYAGTGSHLSFACQNTSSRLRVSDVVISSWNGMMDSARSMDSEKSDVVLLTNGTDRFSGELVSIDNGELLLRGSYAELRIPVEDVQEIRFARDSVRAPDDDASANAVRLRLQPVGRITVAPVSATARIMKSRSSALGEIDIDLDYASILEFSFSDSILDNWDDDF